MIGATLGKFRVYIKTHVGRFGPGVTNWPNCRTREDFLERGLAELTCYHMASGFALWILCMISPSPLNSVGKLH